MAMLVGIASATAEPIPEDLQFVQLIDDDQDAIGFADIRSIAVAEPGNGTILIRFQVQDASIRTPSSSTRTDTIFLYLPTGNQTEVGMSSTGQPYWRRNVGGEAPSQPPFLACWSAMDDVYCVFPYWAMAQKAGGWLNDTQAYGLFAGVRVEQAPGSLVLGADVTSQPGQIQFRKGIPYQLSGCTRIGGCSAPSNASKIDSAGESAGQLSRTESPSTQQDQTSAQPRDAPIRGILPGLLLWFGWIALRRRR